MTAQIYKARKITLLSKLIPSSKEHHLKASETAICKTIARSLFCVLALSLFAACSPAPVEDKPLSAAELDEYRQQLTQVLEDPVARTKLIAKVFGATDEDERHAFLKFHIYGYAGDGNIIPFFTMNNYVVQQWKPSEGGNFEVRHFEVGYYSEFDQTEPIEEWENPLTGETVTLPHFVLGPLPRYYGPDHGGSSASFAPDPLNITMIGDRVYIPTLTKIKFPNSLTVEEWGPYGNGPISYWDSMLVYSANVVDVFDDEKTKVPAEMHMQNLVSWAPFLKVGDSPGRTMARAYGQHISGYDALPKDIRAGFEKYTPEIFDIDKWTTLRIDSAELENHLAAQRAAGTLDIDQEDYVPFTVKKFNELDD